MNLFLRLYDFMRRHIVPATAVLLLACGACVWAALHVHYEEDITKFLPRDEHNERYADIYEQLGNQSRIAVLFRPARPDSLRTTAAETTDEVAEAMTRFEEAWNARYPHWADALHTSVDDTQADAVFDFVTSRYGLFMTDADYARIDSLLHEPGFVAAQLAAGKQQLMLPTGAMTRRLMPSDPLMLFSPVVGRMADFKLNGNYQTIDGHIFTNDGIGLAFIDSRFGMSESGQNAQLAAAIDSTIADIDDITGRLEISAVGAPLIAATNARQIKHDSIVAMAIALTLIFALLIIAFRSLANLLWIGTSLLFGGLFALGGMALFHDSISIIVLGIGSVIIGIAVNYPLHFIDHLAEGHPMRDTLREMVPPLLIGNITTVSAFLCLIWLDAAAMRDLGLFGSLMLIGTILFVLVFMPLYVRTKPRRTQNGPRTDIGTSARQNRLARSPLTLALVAALTLFLGYRSQFTSFDDNMSHINYMTRQQRRDLNILQTGTQPATGTQITGVAEGKTLEQALLAYEHMLPAIDSLRRQNAILTTSGIGRFMPSGRKQQELARQWNTFWQQRADSLASELQAQALRQGFNPSAFQPFIDQISQPLTAQPADSLSPIMQAFDRSYLMQTDTSATIVLFMQVAPDREEDVKSALTQAGTDGAFCGAFSQADISNQLVSTLQDSFNYIGFVCGFVVFFFLWLSFGRIELSLLSFLPLAVSWLWILGIMDLTGIRFNIVNIILATFIFGQGDDYTIFITEGLICEYAYGRPRLRSYSRSVLLSAAIMFIGIGTLILARHPAMKSLAEVTIIGMACVVLMAYYLPPLVFGWLTTRHGRKREVPVTLGRLLRSVFAITFFSLLCWLFLVPYTWIRSLLPGHRNPDSRMRYHQLLCKLSGFIIRHIPGVEVDTSHACHPAADEKPAIYVCNHQSHLDLMCVMSLSPRIVFLTNDWVWHSPLYGIIVRHAGFIPASDGIEQNLEQIRSLYAQGYSICIFPEGTRSDTGEIKRFHRGAFYLAEQLQADIIPLLIHGAHQVLPKSDFMLRRGRISLQSGRRITPDDPQAGNGYRERTSRMHAMYTDWLRQVREQTEDTDYWLPILRYQYLYKGREVYSRFRRDSRRLRSGQLSLTAPDDTQGLAPIIYALTHTREQVTATVCTQDDYDLIRHLAILPPNLHVELAEASDS